MGRLFSIRDFGLSLIPLWIKPNDITWARGLCLIPLCLVHWYWHHPWFEVGIVAFSAFLDILDGMVARFRKEVSKLGAKLDPAMDKLFNHGATILLCSAVVGWGIILTLVAIDVTLTLLRRYKDQRGLPTESNRWGAAKTWAHSFMLGFALSASSLLLLGVSSAGLVTIFAAFSSLAGQSRGVFLPAISPSRPDA